MGRRFFIKILAAFVALNGSMALGQEQKPSLPEALGWDLSYRSIFKTRRVGLDDGLARWLKRTDRSFTFKLLESWGDERIIASVLIEYPAPHAGEHAVVWLIRTEKKAYMWQAVDKGERLPEKKEIEPKLLDNAIKSISSWRQEKPSPIDRPELDEEQRKGLSGYLGFLNFFDGKESRQMLLVFRDLFDDEGRLVKVLETLRKG